MWEGLHRPAASVAELPTASAPPGEAAFDAPAPAGAFEGAHPRAPAVIDPAVFAIGHDDVAAPAPSPPASQLTSKLPRLHFHGVAGIASLPQVTDLTNESAVGVGVRVTIEGHDAGMFEHAHALGMIVAPQRMNAMPEQVSITYRPTKPGHHVATLVLTSQIGTIRIQLEGDALESRIGGTAAVPPSSPEHAREQALEAATDAARVPAEYGAAIASADSTRDSLAAMILDAGTALQARLVDWLVEEGVMAAHQAELGSRASNATDASKFVLLELAQHGLEAAALANPISAAAILAVDLGWDMIGAGGENDGAAATRRATVAHLQTVGSWASSASSDVTRQLVQRYASLMASYEVAKAELRTAADPDRRVEALQVRLARGESPEPAIGPLREVRTSFQARLAHLHVVLRAIASEAVQARPRAAAAFTRLMDRYLRFRGGGAVDAPAHAREIVTTGYLNANAPRPVGLTSTQIGQVDAATLGSSVAFAATRRPLAEMAGWNITIRLAVEDEAIVLRQLATTERSHVIPDDARPSVDRVGGIAGLWMAVDRARVGS